MPQLPSAGGAHRITAELCVTFWKYTVEASTFAGGEDETTNSFAAPSAPKSAASGASSRPAPRAPRRRPILWDANAKAPTVRLA